ncbi:MAG TPA: polymerase, partial [Paenibacillus sp.]
IALSILVHSLLDFNMSYAFMGILVFLGLAGMAVVMDSKKMRGNWNKAGLRLGYFAVLTVGTVFLLFLSISYIGSSNAAIKGKNLIGVSTSYEEIKKPLTEALKTRPGHPESVLYLSSLDQQVFNQTQDEQFLNEAYNVLTRALKDEPYNKNILTQLVTYYDLKGQSDLAYGVYRDNADKFNWDIDWYDTLISRSFLLGQQAFVQKDEAKKQEYFKTELEAYEHVIAGIEHLKTLPPEQMQGRPFSITPTIALNVAKMQQISGQVEDAAATLKLGFNESYADIINSGTLWDMNWYDALISRSYELTEQARAGQDDASKLLYLKIGLQAYNQVVGDLATPTPSIALNAGRIQLMSGQLQNAIGTLKTGLSDDYTNAMNREIARWYLAALTKTGGEDQTIYDKLIAADPAEAAQIEAIANSQF